MVGQCSHAAPTAPSRQQQQGRAVLGPTAPNIDWGHVDRTLSRRKAVAPLQKPPCPAASSARQSCGGTTCSEQAAVEASETHCAASTVFAFLSARNLQQYCAVFTKEGYTELEDLLLAPEDELRELMRVAQLKKPEVRKLVIMLNDGKLAAILSGLPTGVDVEAYLRKELIAMTWQRDEVKKELTAMTLQHETAKQKVRKLKGFLCEAKAIIERQNKIRFSELQTTEERLRKRETGYKARWDEHGGRKRKKPATERR
jgi:hypothetical protein